MSSLAVFPLDPDPIVAVSMGLGSGVLGIFFVMYLYIRVLMAPVSSVARVNEISLLIRQGANAFLRREYLFIAIFAILAAAVLGGITENTWKTSLVFLFGALVSSFCGLVGMSIAVRANVRTTVAAEKGLNAALRVAFNSGAVMGFSVVSFGVVGLSISYLLFDDTELLAAFGFGASSVALFARTGGGIFTKAADVGADLVGKVEANLPEDDPRNAGTIADNVGDNVGDVAGLGSDLFESYCGSLLASADLGYRADGEAGVALSFWIAGFGILCSIIGSFFVRTGKKAEQAKLLAAMRRGVYTSIFLVILTSAFSCIVFYGAGEPRTWKLFGCVIIGLVSGAAVGTWTEYCTSFAYAPTLSIARSGSSGTAPVIIQGIAVGMLSAVFPVVVMSAAVVSTYELADVYGTSIAAVGMLATLGVTLATDSFGPVSDNAGGIAEMAELPEYVRERTDALDALGNTTAATGKGFAIASAVLTALALIQSFTEAAGVEDINILEPEVLAGLLIGVLLPYVFSALTMMAVGAGAQEIIREVRRQFHEIPGLLEGEAKCDPATCVSKCTTSALSEMVIPGLIAVTSPIIVGFLMGATALGGMLMGAIVSGFLLAVFMANSGGAWDNAKKACEAGLLGEDYKKGSEAHKANVEGDCVGDPFKDVSGPSMDVLAKMMAMIALVLAELFEEGWKLWYVGLAVLLVVTTIGTIWYFIKRRGQNAKEFGMYIYRYVNSKLYYIKKLAGLVPKQKAEAIDGESESEKSEDDEDETEEMKEINVDEEDIEAGDLSEKDSVDSEEKMAYSDEEEKKEGEGEGLVDVTASAPISALPRSDSLSSSLSSSTDFSDK